MVKDRFGIPLSVPPKASISDQPIKPFDDQTSTAMLKVLKDIGNLFEFSGMPSFAKAVLQIRKDLKDLNFQQAYTPSRVKDAIDEDDLRASVMPPAFDSGGITMCPHCRNPLSDEMVKDMKKGKREYGGCPNCQTVFKLADLDNPVTH